MAADLCISLLALIPRRLVEIFLVTALLILTFLGAMRKAEIGYEDEAGFHYGNARQTNFRATSRSAKSTYAPESQSCDHSRSREGKTSGSHIHSKRQ